MRTATVVFEPLNSIDNRGQHSTESQPALAIPKSAQKRIRGSKPFAMPLIIVLLCIAVVEMLIFRDADHQTIFVTSLESFTVKTIERSSNCRLFFSLVFAHQRKAERGAGASTVSLIESESDDVHKRPVRVSSQLEDFVTIENLDDKGLHSKLSGFYLIILGLLVIEHHHQRPMRPLAHPDQTVIATHVMDITPLNHKMRLSIRFIDQNRGFPTRIGAPIQIFTSCNHWFVSEIIRGGRCHATASCSDSMRADND
jgi:hypothetical protein